MTKQELQELKKIAQDYETNGVLIEGLTKLTDAATKLIDRIEKLEKALEKPQIKIGDYYLSYYHGDDFWLEHKSGEAMQVRKEFMERLIADYYKENF